MSRWKEAAMADTHNLSTDALVRKVLTDDHADLVREAVSFLCHQIMEAEVSAQIGAGLGERAPAERATGAQRLPRAPLGHARRHARSVHPEGPSGLVLSELPRAAHSRR